MVETGAKRLDLLMMAVTDAKRVGVLWNSDYPPSELREIERAARSLDRELIPVDVRDRDAFEPAFRAMVGQRADALIMVPGIIFTTHLQQIVDLAAKARLPAIFVRREFVESGGLMSYGPNDAEKFRRAAAYVDKILKGAKPADLPVEQPTKFELVINLKTAKALGLTIPPILLAFADEVIE